MSGIDYIILGLGTSSILWCMLTMPKPIISKYEYDRLKGGNENEEKPSDRAA